VRIGSKPDARVQNRRVSNVAKMAVAAVLFGALCFAAGILVHRQGYVASSRIALTALPSTIRNAIEARRHPVEVPTLVLDIAFKNLLKLDEKRREAFELGYLATADDDFVPASIAVDGEQTRVRLRLKGDWVDHLREDKWSFRVKTRGDKKLFGMKVFSLQQPATRSYDDEWLFQRIFMRDGLLGQRYFFVRLILNGDDKGIYALEEHFSKELLEAQQRRESVIIKFDETGMFETGSDGRLNERELQDDYTRAGIDEFQSSRVAASPTLAAQRDAALRLLKSFVAGDMPASRVFKVPELARFFAINGICGTWHGVRWHNMRFYYDPIEGNLEPIAFDLSHDVRPHSHLVASFDPWAQQALSDPAVARAYATELVRLSDTAYMEQLRNEFYDEWRYQVMALLHQEWPGHSSDVWERIASNQLFVQRLLRVTNVAIGYAEPDPAAIVNPAEMRLAVYMRGATYLPVEVVGFNIAGEGTETLHGVGDLPAMLPGPHSFPSREQFRYLVTVPADFTGSLEAACRIPGSERIRLIPINVFSEGAPKDFRQQQVGSVADVLKKHSFLTETSLPGTLEMKPGTWDVDGDLVLPEGIKLKVSAGTTLRFAPAAVMVCSGSLDLLGTPEAPIYLVAQSDSWAGIIVTNAGVSRWQNVVVKGTTSINRHGWTTTGGVTFYRSPVRFSDCRFTDSSAEDVVNVVRAKMSCERCVFARSASDAFDGDFMEGTFRDCTFHDIGGDGIDISGSRVTVETASFSRIGDKALSVGEQSEMEAATIRISDARFGVVSKDSSHIQLQDVKIEMAEYGLAAFVKKPEYGPATIDCVEVEFNEVAQDGLVQTGSSVVVDQVYSMASSDFDVSELYADE